MAAESGTPERELMMWKRVRPSDQAGQPDVLVSSLTPFPFWAVVASIVIFLPLALIVSFFVKRQVVIVEGGGILVLTISFWRYRIQDELLTTKLGDPRVGLDGKVLEIDDLRLHLEPGWLPSAEKLVEINERAAA